MIDPSQLPWPDLTHPPDKEQKEALYNAKLGVVTSRVANLAEQEKAAWASHEAQLQAILNAYLDVAKGQIDRATGRAEFIEKAAGTIATLYTGILAFTYNADLTKGKAFPAVGIAPTIFLGLSIVFAMFYLAYIKQPRPFQNAATSGLLPEQLLNDRNDFIGWTTSSVLERAPWLQTSVISLGLGVLFLPIVYITPALSETALWWIIFVCLVGVFAHLIFLLVRPLWLKREQAKRAPAP